MKQCFFCQKNTEEIDYKNVELLKNFVSSQYRILPRRKTLVCATHQRHLAKAIKRARQMALMPDVLKH